MTYKSKTTTIKKTAKPVKTIVTKEKKYAYKVEHNVKLTSVRYTDVTEKFPFELMKIGDSFIIPDKDPVAKKPYTLYYAAIQYAKMIPGYTVTSRLQINGERRVWRIK
jgi:hypothetical protein